MSRGGTLFLVENDQARLRCELENQDITGFTFLFRLRRDDASLVEIIGAIEDAEGGVFFFDFGPGDLRPGCHVAEVTIVDPTGVRRSYPSDESLTVLVREAA